MALPNCPGAHCVHTGDSGELENVPSGQAVHSDAPGDDWNEPAAQGVQMEEPLTAVERPVGHSAHDVLPDKD